MDLEEPVTPIFPNADFGMPTLPCLPCFRTRTMAYSFVTSTGIMGCNGILHALIERAKQGGSFGVDVSLHGY